MISKISNSQNVSNDSAFNENLEKIEKIHHEGDRLKQTQENDTKSLNVKKIDSSDMADFVERVNQEQDFFDVSIQYDESAEIFVAEIRDAKSGDVIKTRPPEYFLQTKGIVNEFKGLILDEFTWFFNIFGGELVSIDRGCLEMRIEIFANSLN